MSVWREPLYWNGVVVASLFWGVAFLSLWAVLGWHERRKARRPRRAAPMSRFTKNTLKAARAGQAERQVRREQLRERLTGFVLDETRVDEPWLEALARDDDTVEQERVPPEPPADNTGWEMTRIGPA